MKTTHQTVTYRKNADTGFYDVLAYGREIDVDKSASS